MSHCINWLHLPECTCVITTALHTYSAWLQLYIYEIISNKHINCNYFSVKGRAEDVNSPMSRDDLKMRIIN